MDELLDPTERTDPAAGCPSDDGADQHDNAEEIERDCASSDKVLECSDRTGEGGRRAGVAIERRTWKSSGQSAGEGRVEADG
jgi:hypothetical protein